MPDAQSGTRVLMVRYMISKGQTVTFTLGVPQDWTDAPAVNRGYGYFIGGYNDGTDRVTVPDELSFSEARNGNLVHGTPVAAIQFLTKNPVVMGMTCGDSHHDGCSTTSGINNYLAQMVTRQNPAQDGNLSLGWVNCAVSGLPSSEFLPRLEAFCPFVQPSFVVLPGWSFNDRNNDVHADDVAIDRFLSRLMAMADEIRRQGVLPVWLTPIPRDPAHMGPLQIAAWQAAYNKIMGLAPGEIVVDVSTPLTAGTLAGVWLSDSPYTSDGVHPNDRGHELIGALVMRALSGIDPSLAMHHFDDEATAERSVSASADVESVHRLVMDFESLGGSGHGCEFGIFQREFGAEPLGLLRWADLAPHLLAKALECEFEGVGLAENTVLFVPPGTDRPEYWTRDSRYWMAMRTFVAANEVPENQMREQACRRLQFLRDKLIGDLQAGEKIFVFKAIARNLSDEEIRRLHAAVRGYGDNTLLYVRYEDEEHPNGTVEIAAPGLLIGYMDRFSYSPEDAYLGPATHSWLTVCQNAHALWQRARGASTSGADNLEPALTAG